MGYHSTTTWKWTDWRLPTIVSQYNAYGVVNSGTCYAFQNLSNITHNTMNDWADIPSSGGVNNTHASPRVYCYGFGFDQVVPEGAEIKTIDVKRIVSNWTYGSGGIKDKLVTLRTSDNNTYEGWSPNYNTDSSLWVVRNATEEKTTSKSAVGSSSTTSSWGATDVSASHVRRSNFGCVIQCTGTSSVWKTPRIYAVMMRIEYGVTTQYWVDPVYSLNASLSSNTIKDDGSNNSTLSISNINTNNESGTLPELKVEITDSSICCFSDGTGVQKVSSRSTSEGQTLNNTFTIIGKKAGTTTIKITCGNNSKTLTVNVEETYVPPIYSATVSLSSNSITKGQSTNVTIKIQNTNNVEGTVPQTTLKLNGNAKFNVNNVLQTSISIESFYLDANSSKTFSYIIQGITVGADTLAISNSEFGTKTSNITINSPPPLANIFFSSLSLEENEVGTLEITLENIGEVPFPAGELNIYSSDPLRFDSINSGVTSKVLSFSEIPINKSKVFEVQIVGIAEGTGTITASINEKNFIKYITIKDKAEYSIQGELSSPEVTKGDIFQLSVIFTNTNNIAGKNPPLKVQLPSGITTLDGKSEYTFSEETIHAGSTLTLMVNLVATEIGEKTITISNIQLNIKINEIIIPDPVLNSNWVYTTKTNLFPDETGQLIISYEVMNDIFPATIPQTNITITGDSISFTDDTSSKIITQQILLDGETFNNETDNPIFFKFKKEGTATINISNTLLGEKNIQINTQYRGPNFVSTASVNPEIIEHTPDGSLVTIQLKTTNTGDIEGIFPGSTLTVTGNVLAFAENQNTQVLADVSIPSGESVTQTAFLYTKTTGTGTLRIINNENNFNSSFNIIVEAPPNPEYSVSLSCSIPSIPVWSGDEQISSTLKLTFINTNNLAGSINPLIIYLEGDLVFTDETSSADIDAIQIPRGETVEYTVPKQVKSNTVGTYKIRVWDTVLEEDITTSTIDVRGATPLNKGWINLENCTFIENKSSIGGALCNYGKYFDKNSKYQSNSALDKCPNIYDNGVCK